MNQILYVSKSTVNVLLCILIVFSLAPSDLTAISQNPASDQNHIQLTFKHISLPEDLPLNEIKGILQDYNGYMWFASKERLYRYDGNDFSIFPIDMDIRLKWAGYNITAIIECPDNTLWVGTEKGLFKFNSEYERIEHFQPENSRVKTDAFQEHITCLFKDRQNRLWIGTRNGLFVLDIEHNRIRDMDFKTNGLPGDDIRFIKDITEDSKGTVWMATDAGLIRLTSNDRESGSIKIADSKAIDSQIKNPIKLFVDSQKILWIGTSGSGLYRLKPDETAFTHFEINLKYPGTLSNNVINHISEDSLGRIWIGNQQNGLDVLDKQSGIFFHQYHDPVNPDSLSHNSITYLYRDRSSTIWIGTPGSGLNYWNPSIQKFKKHQYFSGGVNTLDIVSIHSFSEDPEGRIWIGGHNGLNRLNPQTLRFRNIAQSSGLIGDIQSVYINPLANNSIIWLGLKNQENELKKLHLYSWKTLKEYDFDKIFDFKGTTVTALLAENKNTLWIGTDQGLFKMNTESSKIHSMTSEFPQLNDLNDDRINVLFRDQDRNIWVGSSRSGLIRFDPGHSFHRYLFSPNDINSISINEVLSIAEDQNNQLWIGTSRGLNRFIKTSKTFIHYTKKNGLPDNTVTGILAGSEGYLWLSTKKGLSRFNISTQIIRNFTTEDGLQSNTFNTGAYYKTRAGQLFFGGIRGMNFFFPRDVQINRYIPPVRITNFEIFNRSTQVWQSKFTPNSKHKTFTGLSEIKLSHNENTLTFHFSALNYVLPEKNQYAIKMEGLDEEWNYIKHLRHATYSGIAPGKYTFRVKASNNEGIWNEEGTAVKIFIDAPFLSNTWIRIFGMLIFIIFIAAIFFFRTLHLRKRVEELKKNYANLNQEIEETRRVDEETRASEKKYRHLVESSSDPIFILYNRKFELINEKFKQLFHVNQEYVCGSEFDYLELISLKSKNFVERKIQQIIDEKQVECQFNLTAITSDQNELELEASVTTIQYKDGIAVQGIFRDITERKNMEKLIQQAQKLEALGTLAGGIAHDFNNLLTGIQGRVSLMQIGFDKKSSPKDHLKEMEHYVKNAADLTKQLLGFARKGKFEVKPININNLVKDNVLMFGRTKKEIGIRAQYQDDIWTVEVDPGQMDQVFMNLFVNAWQAMPESGDILIETRNVYLDHNKTKPHLVQPGKFIKISVTDTGKGMDDETRQRIFDPFFTTKERGRGTGLGLATVYGILKNHGGFITVHSELGIGSTFDVFLPASSKQPVVEKVIKEDLIYGSETIMLVDDEEIVIEVVGQILESLGYNVFIARSGKEALEIYWGKKDEIDLVILDMVMPKMSGAVTFERLKGVNPNVKVLLSSGYSVDGQASELLQKGCNGFIQKPFNIKELSKKIRDVLDEAIPSGNNQLEL